MPSVKDHVKTVLGFLKRKRALNVAARMKSDIPDDTEVDALEAELAQIPLLPSRRKKLAVFAELLGTSEERAAVELYTRMFSGLPDRSLPAFLLPDMKIKSCERIGEDLFRIELKEGRAFFGQRSNEKEYLLHNAFKFYLPEIVNGDAYKLALDIQRRYWSPRLHWYNANGGVFVEGGCFAGMKAIRWHDLATKPLRILAVEIGKANAEILAANIRENGLGASIVPIHAGLWRENGEGAQKHSFSTRRFLETSDRWKESMLHEEKVRLLSVHGLLDEQGVDVADYFNIQVNGAEIEVMKGAIDSLDRVKVFDIAAYYSQDGTRNADVVRELLTQNGCTIIHESKIGRIAAVTPKFRDEILALKPSEKGRRRRG